MSESSALLFRKNLSFYLLVEALFNCRSTPAVQTTQKPFVAAIVMF
jgi:hypothetical protein